MVDAQLTSTIDLMLMSIQHFLPTEDAGGFVLPTWDAGEKMSAQCLVVIVYVCLSIFVEVKHA